MDCYCGHSLQSHNKDGCQHADSATKSGMDLVCRCAMTPDQIADTRIATLEAELADARTANEMAAKRFKEFEQDGATIRDLREKLDAIRTEYAEYKNIVAEAAHADGLKIYNLELDLIFANRAASANLRMAKEQAAKVEALRKSLRGISNAAEVARMNAINALEATK